MTESPVRIALIHFFMTGPSLKYDQCFQFGIRVISDQMQQPVTRIQSFSVNRPITETVLKETGYKPSETENLPSFSASVTDLRELAESCDYLYFFGGQHEQEWLKTQFPSIWPDKILNLKLAAQLLFPFLDKFTLKNLEKLSGSARQNPRMDMEAGLTVLTGFLKTCYLKYQSDEKVRFFISRCRALTSPDPLHFFLGSLIPELDRFQAFQLSQPDLLMSVPDQIAGIELYFKQQLRLKSIPLNLLPETEDKIAFRPVSPAVIRDYFESGKLGRGTDGFDRRDSQVDYALSVTSAINQKTGLLLEAGTGTGKTLGYLLPAMEFLRLNPGKRIIVSTAMKNLQHQIFWKEIQRIKSFFPQAFRDLQVSVLKGKSNYVCLGHLKKKLVQTWNEELFNYAKDDTLLSLYLVHLAGYRHLVDLESIPQEIVQRFPDLPELLEQVRSDIVCFKGSCDYGGNCVYDQTVKGAERSQLVIVNHAKFFNMPQFLTDNCHAIIIDEADLFPAYFKGSLSVEINAWEIRKLISSALGKKGRPGWRSQIKLAKGQDKLLDADGLIDRIGTGLQKITRKLQTLAASRQNFYLPDSAEITSEYELKQIFSDLSEPVQGLNQLMQEIRQEEGFSVPVRVQSLFAVFLFRLETLAAAFNLFSRDYLSKTYCHFASVRDQDWTVGKRAVYLHERFREWVEDHSPSWIFTSATMTLDGSFDFFTRELGIPPGDYEEISIPSPFHYPEQAAMGIAGWIPPYTHHDYRVRLEWNNLVSDTCGYLAAAANGRTLILCTSYEQMESIYKSISDPLESAGIMVYRQDGASVDIMNQFAENEHSVLIGVDRMWTGVDFPGSTLSQVIIVKLPFTPVDDPEMKHRQVVEGQAFWGYYNGIAKLKFRQGTGRLIRTRKDTGMVVVLDSRISTGKNQQFLQNIPNMPVYPFKNLSELAGFLLRKTKLDQEFRRREQVILPVLKKFGADPVSL